MSLAKDKPYFAVMTDYEDDFAAWCHEQAELVRLRRFAELDLPNIVEELVSMGNEQRHALESFYVVLIVHLLKWQLQPERRSRSWDLTITNARNQIERRERRNPSLHAQAKAIVTEIYPDAVREAAKETGLDRSAFPGECPYTIDFLRDHDAMPE